MFNNLKDKLKPTTKVGTEESNSANLDYDQLDAYITPVGLAGFAGKKIDKKITIGSELGELLIETCLHILQRAVKLTSTKVDDELLEVVAKALENRD